MTAPEVAELQAAVPGAPIVAIEPIPPWMVARLRLADGGTAIVKWSRPAGDSRSDRWRMVKERAALDFLAGLRPGATPRVLGHGHRFVVLTDGAPRQPLRDHIRRHGSDPVLLNAFARALARLHAATSGRAGQCPQLGWTAALNGVHEGMRQLAARGGPVSVAAAAELSEVLAVFAAPGPFQVLSNGDPQTNNILLDPARPDDGWLIDFEGAGFQHALLDLVSLYVPGPMWMRVGDPAADGCEQTYRTELAVAVPAVTDDRRFGAGLAGAGLTWAALRLANLPAIERRPPGRDRAHRIATLEAAAELAERWHTLPALTGWARAGAARLRRRWPAADVSLTAVAPYTDRW